MCEWVLLESHDSCFTVDGCAGEVSSAFFDGLHQLQDLGKFRDMVYLSPKHDFYADRKRQVTYKISYKVEKLEGGFF